MVTRGTVAQLHRLPGQGERPGDQRLGGHDRRSGGNHHHRIQRPGRHQSVERVLGSRRTGEQHCPLAEVVERQRRQHHG